MQWWRQSEADLQAAELNLKYKQFYVAVFLCQQAVEKGLKAVYIEKKRSSPGTTHSLIYLASEIGIQKKHMPFLRKLTPQFVNTRYPDAAYGTPQELYDEEIAREFFTGSQEVMQWLRSQIGK